MARKRSHVPPGYEKGPQKLEDRAFCRTRQSTIHYSFFYHTHSSNMLVLKIIPLIEGDASHSAQLSDRQRQLAEYRDGKAQAMATKRQCLPFKIEAMFKNSGK